MTGSTVNPSGDTHIGLASSRTATAASVLFSHFLNNKEGRATFFWMSNSARECVELIRVII